MLRILFIFTAFLLLDLQPISAMSKAPVQTVHTPSDAIGVRTLKYEDKARKRPVVVELWYPTDRSSVAFDEPMDKVWIHPQETRNTPIKAAQSSYPLILMSHGHRGDRRERSWLADILVKQGSIVAAVEHFGNTWNQYIPLISLRFWERAKDVSFALDRLLEEPLLQGRIDSGRIGFVGYSLGGMTGLALAGAQAKNTREIVIRQQENMKELTRAAIDQVDFSEADKSYFEPRIRSMFLICPATFVYPPESLSQVKIPIGLVAAINDEVLPHQEHAYQIIKHLVPYKLKVMRKEISHYAFLNRITEFGRKHLQKAIQSDPPCCDRASIHREVGAFAIEFFQETLQKNELGP